MSGGPRPTLTRLSGPFWEGTRAGELRLRLCNSCGARFRFVRELCPRCWSNDLGWQLAAGGGTVIARAIVHTAPYESMEARVPYALALIELSEGVTMMANVLQCDPDDVHIGMKVSLFFEERGEIMLPQFRPAAEGAVKA